MSTPEIPYRVYCYDSAHKVVTGDWLQATSDEEAIAKATAAGFGSKCEIWHGERLVAQLADDRRQA